MRQINDAGLKLIQEFEGTRLTVYNDSVGKPTVGTGHLVLPQDNLRVGDIITQDRADQLLRSDLQVAERAVEHVLASIKLTVNDNQFAALVSFAFNLGEGRVYQLLDIPERMMQYNHAGGKVVAGLTRRRKAERDLFLKVD